MDELGSSLGKNPPVSMNRPAAVSGGDPARFPRTGDGGLLWDVQVWHRRGVPRCWAQPCPRWTKADAERSQSGLRSCALEELPRGRGPESEEALLEC